MSILILLAFSASFKIVQYLVWNTSAAPITPFKLNAKWQEKHISSLTEISLFVGLLTILLAHKKFKDYGELLKWFCMLWCALISDWSQCNSSPNVPKGLRFDFSLLIPDGNYMQEKTLREINGFVIAGAVQRLFPPLISVIHSYLFRFLRKKQIFPNYFPRFIQCMNSLYYYFRVLLLLITLCKSNLLYSFLLHTTPRKL